MYKYSKEEFQLKAQELDMEINSEYPKTINTKCGAIILKNEEEHDKWLFGNLYGTLNTKTDI